MNRSPVQLAAQSDLVLLTVEMLRAPIPQSAAAHTRLRAVKNGKPDWTYLHDEQVEALLNASGLEEPRVQSISLASALHDVFGQVRSLDLDIWNDEYWRLFDSTMACPLNQAAYIRRDKGVILGDLAGFYRAFGWQNSVATGERPDNLLAQLEFVSLLFAMTAAADQPGEIEVCRDALAKFARLHMHDWLPSFCRHLCDSTCLSYFGAVSQWLILLWESLTKTHQWPVDLVYPRLDPERDQENPYECAANGLVQLGTH